MDRQGLEALLLGQPTVRDYLRAVQAELNWVPREAINLAADHFQTTYMAVYEQVAFSSAFCLEERGRVVVEVCAGLACREAGSPALVRALEAATGVPTGTTKADGSVSLCRQSCFGRCAIGPNVRIQGRFYAGQSAEGAGALLKSALGETGGL
jgi:NADH:ubiquinone oxidoreductase subunit E